MDLFNSVTGCAAQAKQPDGGYISPKDFSVEIFDDGVALSSDERLRPTVVGGVVDGLTRIGLGLSPDEAFRVAIEGSGCQREQALNAAREIEDLGQNSISNAVKLAKCEGYVRGCMEIDPTIWSEELTDEATLSNVRTMVERSCRFFSNQKKMVKMGSNSFPRALDPNRSGRVSFQATLALSR